MKLGERGVKQSVGRERSGGSSHVARMIRRVAAAVAPGKVYSSFFRFRMALRSETVNRVEPRVSDRKQKTAPLSIRNVPVHAARLFFAACAAVLFVLVSAGMVPTALRAIAHPHDDESTANAKADALLLPDSSKPTFTLDDAALKKPVTVIAYGDMRFTNIREKVASDPKVRMELVRRIAEERPDVLLMNGDVVWHGGNAKDYLVFEEETRLWRDEKLAVFPALGNHEFSGCEPATCLKNWWDTFPALKGRRWYSVRVGTAIQAFALDTDDSLEPGSRQIKWLTSQLDSLPQGIQFVIIALHHPPVADPNPGRSASHNPRPNEIALRNYLRVAAAAQSAKIVVVAGHIHNYERFYQDSVMYIVSGGGGAMPYPVIRTPGDLYKDAKFPNYNYVEFVLDGTTLRGTMYRLSSMGEWEAKDTFQVDYH